MLTNLVRVGLLGESGAAAAAAAACGVEVEHRALWVWGRGRGRGGGGGELVATAGARVVRDIGWRALGVAPGRLVVRGQRWVIAILKNIQLANTLTIISGLSSWVEKTIFI